MVADKLSRLGQTIQMKWSLLSEVFISICNRWHWPKIDLFAMRFNNKLPLFCVTGTGPPGHNSGSTQSAMGRSGHIRLPTTSHIGQVEEKLNDFLCKRKIIMIARGWSNMPWFSDLVAMSTQIPLSLPNLLTQPFNQIPHRNQTSLNLHAWLLEPRQSRDRASLRQWQQELRLLKRLNQISL